MQSTIYQVSKAPISQTLTESCSCYFAFLALVLCFKQISFIAEFTAGNIQNNPHQKAKIDLFMEPGSRALKSGSGSGAGVGTGTGNPGTAIHLNLMLLFVNNVKYLTLLTNSNVG